MSINSGVKKYYSYDVSTRWGNVVKSLKKRLCS